MDEHRFPAVTVFVEASARGRRREYVRRSSSGPGQSERRRQRALGLSWCRGCRDWLPSDAVRSGVCRPHANAEYRRAYAADGEAIRFRVHARKRDVAPMSPIGAEYLTEQFDGLCAYCPSVATTWDHVVPVAGGGDTEPGNVVPACASCNASKKDKDVVVWLIRTGRSPHPCLLDVLSLQADIHDGYPAGVTMKGADA